MSNSFNKKVLTGLILSFPGIILAQTAAPAAPAGNWLDINTLLLIIAIVLLFPVIVLGKALIASAEYYLQKMKGGKGTLSLLLPALLMLGSYSALAQDAAAAPVAATSTSPFDMISWILIVVILTEALVIFVLGGNMMRLLKQDEAKATAPSAVTAEKKSGFIAWWNKINNFKSAGEEDTLDTGHDYDGIRELDNVTPSWFTAAFVMSIIFAIVYLWRYHVSKTAPLQIEEFETEMAVAKAQQDAFLKTQAQAVDENTVVLMTAATDLSAGKVIFDEKCAVCHKTDGGGLVGPNLTDDYWIHGGSIGNIFKTVKYGVPDKGMIPWQDQLSAVQMAQVSSYIKTLHGTNPAGAKEKQGELYTETAAVADSAVATTPM